MELAIASPSGNGGTLTVSDVAFGREFNEDLVHQAVTAYLAGARQGTKSQKSRSEVSGGGRKPWRQKGTGRARSGNRRSPLWRGGGTVFGPKPRSYAFKLSKKVRRQGICVALSARLSEENLTVLDAFKFEQIKTKDFVKAMQALQIDNALIVLPDHDDTVERSSRNVPGYKVMLPEGLNVYDILLHRHVILLQNSVDKIEKRLLS